MEFSTWLEAKGFDAASLSKEQKATLQAAWRVEQAPPAPAPEPAPADDRPKPESAGFDAQMAAIEAENERIKTIQDMGVKAAGNYVGDANKTRDLRKLTEAAVSDKTTSVKDFQLALLRFDRVTGPMILPARPASSR
jgi:hypothetical protein